MPIETKYEQLVKAHGKEAANAYMKEMRSKVKSPGLANVSAERRKEISRMGVEARKAKRGKNGLGND